MLQRVFAGAYHEGEYSAAHNAAFSLARLYGHVTDRASIEILRRPSRDPDAPSEVALGDWVAGLGTGPQGFGSSPEGGPQGLPMGLLGRVGDAPANPLEITPNASPELLNVFNDLTTIEPSPPSGPEGSGPELLNEIKGLGDGIGVGGRPENGAPSPAVTGTPNSGARSKPLSQGARVPPPPKKRGPTKAMRVPVKKRVLSPRIPSAKDLFG
jgi:hypothetical protein